MDGWNHTEAWDHLFFELFVLLPVMTVLSIPISWFLLTRAIRIINILMEAETREYRQRYSDNSDSISD